MGRRSVVPIAWITLGLLVAFNIIAWRHARFFFEYVPEGVRTPPPERLSAWQKAALLVKGVYLTKPAAHDTPASRGMPYEEITAPGRDGLTLAAWRIPSADSRTTVLLFHGYNSEKSGLLPEAHLFFQLGFSVVMVDFPGAGASPGYRTSLGIFEAEDVAVVLRWARERFPDQQIVLYGHSMGAAAVMRSIALNGARPDAVVIESVFDSLLRAIRFRFALLHVPSWPAAETLLFWGSVQLGANGFAHQPVRYAEAIDVPALVVHGRFDSRADWRAAEEIHRRLAGEKALLLVDAGHGNPALADVNAWQEKVRALTARAPRPAAMNLRSDERPGSD